MSESQSSSSSNTYTETRAKYVLGKIYDDFCAIDIRGFDQFEKDSEKLKRWKEDLFFMMQHKDLDSFQLKFSFGNPSKQVALQYTIKADGSIQADIDSGGINYYQFPVNTTIGIIVQLKGNSIVDKYLKSRNWTTGGIFLSGNETSAGSFSKDGYGANRNKIGTWDQ